MHQHQSHELYYSHNFLTPSPSTHLPIQPLSVLAVWTIAPLLLCPSNELDGSLLLLVNLTNSSSIHSQTTLSIALLNLRNRLLLWYLNLLQIFLTTKQMLLNNRLVLTFLLLTQYFLLNSFRPFYSFTDKCSRRSSIPGSPVAVLSSPVSPVSVWHKHQCPAGSGWHQSWQSTLHRAIIVTCILLMSLMWNPLPIININIVSSGSFCHI